MSSAHSYEAGLHDLEKQLDAAPKPRKERPIESAPKKDGFVRTVGFAPSSTPPAHTLSSEALASGESLPHFLANFKKDAGHAASLASSQVILVDRPPAPPGTTPDMASSGSLEARFVLDARPAKPGAEEKPAPKQGKPEHLLPPKQKKQAEMSKVERRELQEKQRAEKDKLKAAASGKAAPKPAAKPPAAKPPPQITKPVNPNPISTPPVPHGGGIQKQSSFDGLPSSALGAAKLTKKKVRENMFTVPAHKQVPLFSHLPQYARSSSQQLDVGFTTHEIHPAIVSLGLKYADGTIRGGNARAVAMLYAFKEVIRDFVPPSDKTFSRSFENALKPLIQFLVESRPISVSMANAINFVKSELPRQATESLLDAEAKKMLQHKIDHYVQERIIASDQLITAAAVEKIADNDIVLTYACSYVVEQILIEANKKKKRFRVVVVDARPHLEGKEMLQRLVKEGVECTYVLLPALSYVMKGVKKVFVGAAAMMNNGGLLSRVGTAMIALMAKAHNVPFLVCCETYKFCERVQLDSICLNELGNPEELRVVPGVSEEASVLRDWKTVEQLKLLHLKYDVTPPELITCMITELGMVPPTSVPVVLREDHTERPAYHDDY